MPPPAARNVSTITAEMGAIAASAPSICTHAPLPHATHEGRTVTFLRITKGPGLKPVVLIIAGVHAREVAPPDAVVDFARMLVTGYTGGANYPAFTDTTAPPVTYSAFSIARDRIRAMVDRLDIYIVPLVNPDGRHFVLSNNANYLWRKNRRPHAAGGPSIGVDVNRNFAMAWPFDRYYSVAAVARPGVSATHTVSDERYGGPAAASEPETRNVQHLVDSKRVAFFVDVHAYGRKVLYPWSTETNQSINNTQAFHNTFWDRSGVTGGRDGVIGGPPDPPYAEFFPNSAPLRLFDDHVALARAMRDAMVNSAGADVEARRRSTYTPEQSIAIGYTSPGASDDYAFSRQLTVPGHPPVRAFTIECGSDLDGENEWHPPYGTKFPKIEREVHTALFALLEGAVTRSPAPTAPPAASSGTCFVLATLGLSAFHPDVVMLREMRDAAVAKRGARGACARAAVRLYRGVGPYAAAYVRRHEKARWVLRNLLLMPLISSLTRVTRAEGDDPFEPPAGAEGSHWERA
jgi:hypothetical protein